jgi:hypothetical protein
MFCYNIFLEAKRSSFVLVSRFLVISAYESWFFISSSSSFFSPSKQPRARFLASTTALLPSSKFFRLVYELSFYFYNLSVALFISLISPCFSMINLYL